MAKTSSVFICQTCAYQSPKWLGQCPQCQAWNSLAETSSIPKKTTRLSQKIKPLKLAAVKAVKTNRLLTGLKEMDQVLGGGITVGSVNLIAGEPGIGKSTLLSQLAIRLAEKQKAVVFYACGEESPQQIKMRMARLGAGKKAAENILLLPQTDVDRIIGVFSSLAKKDRPILIVDSIQTMTTADLAGGAGSIVQTKEATRRLVWLAKSKNIPLFLVGHITKEGSVAGPKTLEHMVDAVFYFEGDRYQNLRLLRSKKNRFGATDEIGLWQMTDKGLAEISDPAAAWIKKNKNRPWPGSAITAVVEGTRPMTIEIQALANKSFLPNPKRVINGLDYNRGQILLAIAQKYLNLPLYKYDVFINTGGGIKTKEPSVDLAVCAAVFSSFKNKPLPDRSAFIGEVSLLGEVKSVSHLEKKKNELKKIGIKNIFDCQKIPFIKNLRQII